LLISLDAFGISILGALGASSLVPHFSDRSYVPGWAPGLPPAKSGPDQHCAVGYLIGYQTIHNHNRAFQAPKSESHLFWSTAFGQKWQQIKWL